ncbi:transcriptional regulator [Alkalilimnicola ehrlichii]|uniref:Transcriptional regulator n=1 Tax=Alkalilimnicola ehrlichii TaxID=351052 RepID=A0A3E0WLT1_9GAMM|nr:helix-turn-helix domain-containing protein [Alkalilimnicola ehrlichii]RFA26820.1 transcriptional regulator [Alkalilimnicola ehrlichii]RFA33914.1 transcriptional regulator [Alkalilimnicola ehrlichii]
MFKIGEVARLSGCSRETIRHYEKLKLLNPPRRAANGYRYYDETAIKRLGFIRHGRSLGLDLQTISELLALAEHPDSDCASADRIARHHLERLEERIASLERLADELRSVVVQCGGGRVADCRIIEALFDARYEAE